MGSNEITAPVKRFTLYYTTDQTWGQFNFGIAYLKKNGIGIDKFGIEVYYQKIKYSWVPTPSKPVLRSGWPQMIDDFKLATKLDPHFKLMISVDFPHGAIVVNNSSRVFWNGTDKMELTPCLLLTYCELLDTLLVLCTMRAISKKINYHIYSCISWFFLVVKREFSEAPQLIRASYFLPAEGKMFLAILDTQH